MNTNTLIKISGNNYNEYLLVLSPHEDLSGRITQVKKEFSEKYKAPVALSFRPHIALVHFIQFEMRERVLLNRLKEIAAGYHPFKVDLNDYGSFPNHTIFINVTSKQQVRNLIRELKPAGLLMTVNKENKPHFMDDPHLAIARKLLPWQYEQGWLEYSHRHFTGSFMANGMLLLKKPLEEKKSYRAIQQFEFMNLPVMTTQGKLFM